MLTRRFFILATLLAGLVTGPGLPAHAQTVPEARRVVEVLIAEAVAMATGGLSDAGRQERFRAVLRSHFDLPHISRLILGRYWPRATPAQQQQFASLFEDMTVLTWSRRFNEYSGETAEVVSVVPESPTMVLVDTRILRAKGPPIPVTWRLRETNGSYKVVDIVVEGVSMALTHRSEYLSALQSMGGDIDKLLAAMRRKVNQLQASPA